MKKPRKTAKVATPNSVPVGRIAGVFGLHGELKCDPTSAGRMLFSAGETFEAALKSGGKRGVTLSSVREHKNRLLVRFEGFASSTDAEIFNGATLYADVSRIELENGEYLDADLVGCDVLTPGGALLGAVERVEHYPASDMLVVNGRLVPMVAQFILSIDVGAKKIVAELPPGLLDDAEAL